MSTQSEYSATSGDQGAGNVLPLNKLRIMHWFRSPVGGIFRHVRDLIEQQIKEGHAVGVVCDDNTGGEFEQRLFETLEPTLELGLHRITMDRSIGPKDIAVSYKLFKEIKPLKADIFHSHGAKGGAYARIIGTALNWSGQKTARLYCPHGGSIHYDNSTVSGRALFAIEQLLERITDHLIFVCEYERDAYLTKVGATRCAHSVVYNGVKESDFRQIHSHRKSFDFGYIGMMRDLKGVDLFLKALPVVATQLGYPVSAILIGDGPDLEKYQSMSSTLGAQVTTVFQNPMNVQEAFPMAEVLVVPSRAESMPYIVLESLAAQRPLVATSVGGIPEIFGEHANLLVESDSLSALVDGMVAAKTNDASAKITRALVERIRSQFSVETMSKDVMNAYKAALHTS